jgi:hypothetical protein
MVPFSREVDAAYRQNKDKDWQYYISKPIVLIRADRASALDLSQRGTGIDASITGVDSIIISAFKPGISEDPPYSDTLRIAFEKRGGPTITFRREGNGPHDRYVMVFYGNATDKIEYDGSIYNVVYDSNEPPSLMVSIEDATKKKSTTRNARGVKL